MGNKAQLFKTHVAAAIADGYELVSNIKDDLNNAIDAMQEKMSNTSRYANYEDIVGILDGLNDVPDIPEAVAELECTYTNDTRTRESATYQVRLDNAVEMVRRGSDRIQEWLESDDQESDKEVSDDVENLKNSLAEWLDELDGITFE